MRVVEDESADRIDSSCRWVASRLDRVDLIPLGDDLRLDCDFTTEEGPFSYGSIGRNRFLAGFVRAFGRESLQGCVGGHCWILLDGCRVLRIRPLFTGEGEALVVSPRLEVG